MSTDAFLKSVKKFPDKEVRIIPFNSRSSSPPYPSHFLFYSTMLSYICGIDCQTTLQVQEKLVSRLPVESNYVVIVVAGYWAGLVPVQLKHIPFCARNFFLSSKVVARVHVDET